MPTLEARLSINPRRALDLLREHRRLLDPFYLEAGRLLWQPDDDEDEALVD